jgi:hypothetical protein
LKRAAAQREGWNAVASQQANTVRVLKEVKLYRPCVSRAYYATYSLITAMLHEQGVTKFAAAGNRSRRNPDHASLPGLIEGTLRGLSKPQRRDLKAALIRLRARREDADYRPDSYVEKDTAREAARDMHYAAELVGALW